MQKVTTITGWILVFLGVTVLVTGTFMFSSSENLFQWPKGDKVGQLGDFIGGFVGSLWTLAGVLFFYAALQDQRKATKATQDAVLQQQKALEKQVEQLILQQEELKLQREELTKSVIAQDASQKALNDQLAAMKEINLIEILSRYIELTEDKSKKVIAQSIVSEITEGIYLSPEYERHFTPKLTYSGESYNLLGYAGERGPLRGYSILNETDPKSKKEIVSLMIGLLCEKASIKDLSFRHSNLDISFDETEVHPHKQSKYNLCLLYTSPSPRDRTRSRMPSSA